VTAGSPNRSSSSSTLGVSGPSTGASAGSRRRSRRLGGRGRRRLSSELKIERYDAGTTRVDHSASAAERAFRESVGLLGRVDVFYSHVTSQLSESEAAKVLANRDLAAMLQGIRRSSGCLLGCSLSHETLLQEALPARGKDTAPWLAMLDVMQLPAVLALRRPDLVAGLSELGMDVVINSPVRGMAKLQPEVLARAPTPRAVIRRLLAMEGVTAVLSGSRTHLKETLRYPKMNEH
jgi:hypothetical protein